MPAAIARACAPYSRPWKCAAPSAPATSITSPISATSAAPATPTASTRRRTSSTSTSRRRWPSFATRATPSTSGRNFSPACSPATVAANGVDFLEPLNPALPAELHEMALPWLSVIVTVVLLNVAETCASPSASTTFFAFFAVAMGYFVTFFLPAIARRGPFLVRAFVCVRCPRTGRPRR